MKTLQERVQALPPELYNQIRDLTFTIEPGVRVIDEHYKPPSCLQVDRSSRDQLTQSYYSYGSIFYIDRKLLSRWKVSLSRLKTCKPSEIRIMSHEFGIGERPADLLRAAVCLDTRHEVIGELGRDVIKYKVIFTTCDQTRWMSTVDLVLLFRMLRGFLGSPRTLEQALDTGNFSVVTD